MSAVPTGWYPDDRDPRRVRYWNGQRFTRHTHWLVDGTPGGPHRARRT